LQPLSVLLPFAARFTVAGDSEPRATAHSTTKRKPEAWQWRDGGGAPLARFWLSLPNSARCRTSEQQTAGDGWRKNGEDNHPDITNLVEP